MESSTESSEAFQSKCIFLHNRTEWRVGGKLHRDGDLPAVERADGDKERGYKSWWKNDKRHRDGDLPAVEYISGTKEWWKNGHFHRDGGLPAQEYADGNKEWWVYGKQVSESESRKWWNEQLVKKRKEVVKRVFPVVCWYYSSYSPTGMPTDLSKLVGEATHPIKW